MASKIKITPASKVRTKGSIYKDIAAVTGWSIANVKVRALRARAKIRAEYLAALAGVDVLLTPTVPTPAFKVGEKASDPLQLYLEDIFTIPANLAGLPAISVPCGKSGHLPVGFHLVGAPLSEAKLLAAGRLFEAAHGYAHQQAAL